MLQAFAAVDAPALIQPAKTSTLKPQPSFGLSLGISGSSIVETLAPACAYLSSLQCGGVK